MTSSSGTKKLPPMANSTKKVLLDFLEIEVGTVKLLSLKQSSSKLTGHVPRKHEVAASPAAAVAGAGSETSGRAARSGSTSETGTPVVGG